MTPTPNPRYVLAPNPSPMTLDGTRTYVVGRDRPAVIDPGPEIPEHIDRVAALLGSVTPLAIILTHGHRDHSGCAIALARATGGPLWMASGAINSPIPAGAIDHRAVDGDLVETDAGVLRVIATPGHAPEHICVHWSGGTAPADGALFAGDLLMGHGDTTLVADPDGDLAAYLDSLARIESLGVETIYPAHGSPLRDVTEAIDRFRSHRLERIQQVREVLGDGDGGEVSAAQLVDRVYGESLDPRLRAAAEASILAVLRYLREGN